MSRTAKKPGATQMQDFKQRLEQERQNAIALLAEIERERELIAIDGPQDAADLCVTNLSRESLFERTSQKNRLIVRIDIALRNIENGTFGICGECGEPISPKRLDAMPWTSYCLHCQEQHERARTAPESALAWG